MWSKEQVDALTSVNQSVAEPLALILRYAKELFNAVGDAKWFAIDGALLQKDENCGNHVILYSSRLLTSAKLNQFVHYKELLSIKYDLVKL